MKRMITIQDFARQLAVSRATGARLIRDGAVASVVVLEGRQRRLVRVSQDAVDEYLEQRTKSSRPSSVPS